MDEKYRKMPHDAVRFSREGAEHVETECRSSGCARETE